MANFIMTWLDPIGVVVGLVIAIPVALTWYEVTFGRKRRERKWFQRVRMEPGSRPAILIVDLLVEKNIRTSVENFRQQNAALRDIADDHIVMVSRETRIDPDKMSDLSREIRKAAGQLIALGVDTIHFFYAGPAIIAAVVGAELANTAQVMVYQHETSGYRNFGPLRGEF